MKDITVRRPIKMDGMAYAPTNEQGVVFLFGRLAPRLGFHVELVQNGFPDCIARRRGKTYRIEFEHRASNYKGHPPRGADVIVCWENDWEPRPKKFHHLEIIDLKKYVGAPRRVFVVGCNERERGWVVDSHNVINWSVQQETQVGDLIVMYRTKPAAEIRDLWTVIPRPPFIQKGWGLQKWLRLVVRLKKPLTYDDLRNDPTTRDLGIVRKRFRGKSDITDDWSLLYAKILKLNPRAKTVLRRYRPD
jgi:hypothetical protein